MRRVAAVRLAPRSADLDADAELSLTAIRGAVNTGAGLIVLLELYARLTLAGPATQHA